MPPKRLSQGSKVFEHISTSPQTRPETNTTKVLAVSKKRKITLTESPAKKTKVLPQKSSTDSDNTIVEVTKNLQNEKDKILATTVYVNNNNHESNPPSEVQDIQQNVTTNGITTHINDELFCVDHTQYDFLLPASHPRSKRLNFLIPINEKKMFKARKSQLRHVAPTLVDNLPTNLDPLQQDAFVVLLHLLTRQETAIVHQLSDNPLILVPLLALAKQYQLAVFIGHVNRILTAYIKYVSTVKRLPEALQLMITFEKYLPNNAPEGLQQLIVKHIRIICNTSGTLVLLTRDIWRYVLSQEALNVEYEEYLLEKLVAWAQLKINQPDAAPEEIRKYIGDDLLSGIRFEHITIEDLLDAFDKCKLFTKTECDSIVENVRLARKRKNYTLFGVHYNGSSIRRERHNIIDVVQTENVQIFTIGLDDLESLGYIRLPGMKAFGSNWYTLIKIQKGNVGILLYNEDIAKSGSLAQKIELDVEFTIESSKKSHKLAFQQEWKTVRYFGFSSFLPLDKLRDVAQGFLSTDGRFNLEVRVSTVKSRVQATLRA